MFDLGCLVKCKVVLEYNHIKLDLAPGIKAKYLDGQCA